MLKMLSGDAVLVLDASSAPNRLGWPKWPDVHQQTSEDYEEGSAESEGASESQGAREDGGA